MMMLILTSCDEAGASLNNFITILNPANAGAKEDEEIL
jgi:hypothetical protein